MRIAVHAKVLSESEPTGIGIYVRNILRALSRIDPVNEYVLYSNEPIRQRVEAANFSEKILRFPRSWSYLRFPFEFVNGAYDLLFVPKAQVPLILRPPTVIVVYDLMGLRFPDRISLSGKVHHHLAVRWAIPAADAVIAISDATKRSIVEKCGVPSERIAVTHLGCDPDVFRPQDDPDLQADVRARYRIDGPYFINTSSLIWYRKNLVRLLEAFADLQRDPEWRGLRLVITGKRGEAWHELLERRSALGLEREVILTGYVPAAEVPVLLSGALALVFPSLDEGFGLPLVEAMACGCPVVTSNVSAMPEVAGDAAVLVDPHDVGALSAAMRTLAGDPALRRQYRERGLERAPRFSWDEGARATLRVFENTARRP